MNQPTGGGTVSGGVTSPAIDHLESTAGRSRETDRLTNRDLRDLDAEVHYRLVGRIGWRPRVNGHDCDKRNRHKDADVADCHNPGTRPQGHCTGAWLDISWFRPNLS